MSSERKTRQIDRISSILTTINSFNNPQQAIEALSSIEDAPRSPLDISLYVLNLAINLDRRLMDHDRQYFPDADDKEIREKLCAPLKEYFEKNPDKPISKHDDSKGAIKITPLLADMYGIRSGTHVIVNCGATSMEFYYDTSRTYMLGSDLRIAFHPSIFSTLFDVFDDKKDEIKRNYRIQSNPSANTAIIDVERFQAASKVASAGEAGVDSIEGELFRILLESSKEDLDKAQQEVKETKQRLEVKEREAEELRKALEKSVQERGLMAKPKPSASLEDRCKRIRGMLGGFTSSSELVLELSKLAADIIGTYEDIDLGVEIGDTCMKIRKIGKPQRTLKEPDMTDYEVEVINCLNKVESKLEWYASHVRE